MSEPPDRQLPTPERFRKGDNIIEISVLKEDGKGGYSEKAGELVALNTTESALDYMFHKGYLGGRQEDAERRYSAGMALRQLYLSVAGSIGVAAYHDAWNAFDPFVNQFSDQDCWNFRVLWDTQKYLRHRWRPVECVCILNRRYKTWPALHTALDILHDYRPPDLRKFKSA